MLVHIDVETTGLDPDVHQICEVAWAVDRGPIKSGRVSIPKHAIVDPDAMYINNHWRRIDSMQLLNTVELYNDLKDNTLCGVNIAFDESFLRVLLGGTPWHYRKLDLPSYAMAKFDLELPPSSKMIEDLLVIAGFILPEVEHHSAAGDVELQRAMFDCLRGYPCDTSV